MNFYLADFYFLQFQLHVHMYVYFMSKTMCDWLFEI